MHVQVDTGSLTCTSLSVNGQNIVGSSLPLSSGTPTGTLTGTSGVFNTMTMGGEAVATTSTMNPSIWASDLNTSLVNYLTYSALTATVNGNVPITGGTVTGNVSCNQLTCTSEVDMGSKHLSCSNLTVNGSLTLPTSYTNAPAPTCLGYMTYSSKTTSLNVPAATGTVIHSLTITQGVWLLTVSPFLVPMVMQTGFK